MSRAFVKEDGPERADLPDLPISPYPNHVTPRGLAALRARLAARQADLAAAKARADRTDRGPEAAAQRDIRYLEARLASAIPVEPPLAPAEVAFATRVRVAEPDGTERTFAIVGEDEADAAAGRIAPQAPLARALIGARVGDVLCWSRPGGALDLEVLEIAPWT